MWTYGLLIALPLFLQHLQASSISLKVGDWGKRSDWAMKLFWLLLLAMLVLRHKTIGLDLSSYEHIFKYICRSDWLTALRRSPEVAWSFMNKLVSLWTDNFRWVIVLTAVLTTYHMAKAYIKYSADAALTIAIFINISCFVMLFSGLRQCVAISLGFLAFEFTRQKKVIPFAIVTLIAFLFHTSAFMIVFMYPLYHIRIRKKWLLWIIPMLFAAFVFNQQIFTFLGLILNTFTDYDATIKMTGSYTMLILFLLFAVFSFVIPEEAELDEVTVGMRNFLLFSVFLQMFAPLHSIAMRMNFYYIVFIPLLIPRIIRCRSTRMSQVAITARHIMLVFFIVYFFLSAPANNGLHTFPYRFFWETV